MAITNRRFVTIPEPDVPELHQLAEAMNSTVERLKLMFDEEAARLEAVRREANFDSLTGLANRDYLIAELRSALDNEHSRGGTLLLIRVADLVGVNRRPGEGCNRRLAGCRVASTIGSSAAASFQSTMATNDNGAGLCHCCCWPGPDASSPKRSGRAGRGRGTIYRRRHVGLHRRRRFRSRHCIAHSPGAG
ncbi:MAG: diguanylate cyclase [Sulfuritalea sp.]|nr:diguanylate cyclase [Sulfuritalea sp.]